METARIDDLLARLAGIPARVAAAVAGWSEARLRAPSGDGWSAAEIFAHMRASDDILAARVPMLLTRDFAPLGGGGWLCPGGFPALVASLRAAAGRTGQYAAAGRARRLAADGYT